MAKEFNRQTFVEGLSGAIKEKEKAVRLGLELGKKGYTRLFLVGCGAPNRTMSVIEYWIKRYSRHVEVRRYFPAEFIHQDPKAIDDKTLIIIGSHSGTTKETVASTEFLKGRPCTTIGITQKSTSPLAINVQHLLTYGETEQGYQAVFIVLLALISAFLKELDDWPFHEEVMSSITALPNALADAIESVEKKATLHARLLKDDRVVYVIGAGPMYSAAYVFGVCVLAESQWMHVIPVRAAEFFHGAFEAIDTDVPVFILMGEDPSRPEATRAVSFCNRFTERVFTYDSQSFKMEGIHPQVRPIVAPHIMVLALRRVAEHLAVWHSQPLSTRRYMWKVEY
jgi:fructoselysine 6-phosphate deglycase